jgi:hypothetical protein
MTMAMPNGPTLMKGSDIFEWRRSHCMTIGAHVGGGTESAMRFIGCAAQLLRSRPPRQCADRDRDSQNASMSCLRSSARSTACCRRSGFVFETKRSRSLIGALRGLATRTTRKALRAKRGPPRLTPVGPPPQSDISALIGCVPWT